jgi:hypothetical protein
MRRIAVGVLFIALACMTSGCTTALTEQQLLGLAEPATGPADVTGSLPKAPRVVKKPERAAPSDDSAELWARHYRRRTAAVSDQPAAAPRLTEPSFRVTAVQNANASPVSPGPAQGETLRPDALSTVREIGTRSEVAPGRTPAAALSFRYAPDALDLSDTDRQSLAEFAKRQSAKKMLVLTGLSAGQSPLETMLRAQERGRRLDALLRSLGEIEIKYDPGLARDVVRIEFDDV